MIVTSRSAAVSPCGQYRYNLSRWLPEGEGALVFIMLNPSTADGTEDDATIRRCLGFASDWGFNHLCVVNLFAWRARHPRDMLRQLDPVGPDGDQWILRETTNADRIIAAWGAHSSPIIRRRADAVRAMLVQHGRALHHLGLSRTGQPKHPLFLARDTEPQVWC